MHNISISLKQWTEPWSERQDDLRPFHLQALPTTLRGFFIIWFSGKIVDCVCWLCQELTKDKTINQLPSANPLLLKAKGPTMIVHTALQGSHKGVNLVRKETPQCVLRHTRSTPKFVAGLCLKVATDQDVLQSWPSIDDQVPRRAVLRRVFSRGRGGGLG